VRGSALKLEEQPPSTRAQELRAFVALGVVLAPVLAVVVVSGYGFVVWMVQLFAGPPGPRF
jgi:periplasmic nitrate reductase NapE